MFKTIQLFKSETNLTDLQWLQQYFLGSKIILYTNEQLIRKMIEWSSTNKPYNSYVNNNSPLAKSIINTKLAESFYIFFFDYFLDDFVCIILLVELDAKIVAAKYLLPILFLN